MDKITEHALIDTLLSEAENAGPIGFSDYQKHTVLPREPLKLRHLKASYKEFVLLF